MSRPDYDESVIGDEEDDDQRQSSLDPLVYPEPLS